MIHNNNKAI